MFDAQSDPVCMQRSKGIARVVLSGPGPQARLEVLGQQGSAKALLPRTGTDLPEIVFLNTSGGLTGGDELDYRLELGAGLRATATTQTAERAYRSAAGQARVRVCHRVGPGGHLDWLPQETILFEGAALHRDTVIELSGDAGCLMLEAVVLGRAAMGETVTRLDFRDRREIRRNGVPVLIEPFGLDRQGLARRGGAALLGGARAFATLALAATAAADALGPVRDALNEPGVEGAASAFDGKCVVRLLAADGWPLRRQILRVLAVLRRRPAPRVWQM